MTTYPTGPTSTTPDHPQHDHPEHDQPAPDRTAHDHPAPETTAPDHPPHVRPLPASDAGIADLLRAWLPGRRWFPAKGADAGVEVVGELPLTDPRGDAEVRILLVRAVWSTGDALLQVPVTLRATAPADGDPGGAGAAWIGTLADPPRQVRDGCGDPAFLRAWLAAAASSGSTSADLSVDPSHAQVITGEQSNTSVILPGTTGDHTAGAAILKVFRAISPGVNPDVEVPYRLTAGGWWHVPRPLGWLTAEWDGPDGIAEGHLSVLSQFVDGAADGFELACRMAAAGESFAELAGDLGAVVADMHAHLATALPLDPDPADDDAHRARVVADAVAERFRWAGAAVPELARYADQVAAVVAEVAALSPVPSLQRIHGDLHLGQVLRAHDEWFVTDFEGEPLVPLAARTRPDLALRDVAGVLRSFDYARAVGNADPAWAEDARAALLAGYGARDAAATRLLGALELDKALYEAVYEARNRPHWSPIPLGALDRLLGG